MTTSDLPLLGVKKSRNGEHWFCLVWFGMFYMQWRPLTHLSSARRRTGMASIDLVWFGISSKQWRPLTLVWYGLQALMTSNLYLLSKKCRDGELTFHWFGLVCFTSNHDLWVTSPWWEEEWGWRALIWFGLVWFFLQAITTSDIPLLSEKKSRVGEPYGAHF